MAEPDSYACAVEFELAMTRARDLLGIVLERRPKDIESGHPERCAPSLAQPSPNRHALRAIHAQLRQTLRDPFF